jgi:hypothetical protein
MSHPQGTDWPVRLGRVDSSDGGAAGRIPADDAPVVEIVAFMKQLGAKPGEGVVVFMQSAMLSVYV